MKEFKLTKQLEKNYSKNQIIELYLNTIYFGNGNYGIEEASQSYFGKSAKNLSIAESAMLAGIISAPSYNEPVSHHATAEKKKNIILKNMQKLGKINEIQYKNAKNEQIVIKNNNNTSINQFIKSVISNASKILNISENQIRNKDIKIVTSLDKKLDSFLNKLVCNKSFSPINETGTTPIVESIIINNKTHQVISYATNQSHNIEGMRRQPGSSIKPILVYAPAFETNKASLNSQILDEKISFGDYCPKNSNDKYLGWTTIQTAIEKSLNIPAIKTLSYVGTTNALNFAKNLGIKFDEKDNHLAIALGGMTHGTTLKELADAYSTFSNEGNFSESGFITKIIDNKSRVIYNYNPKHKRVMSKNTASTITEALIGTVKHGTAKKLKIDGIEIASKTGTTNQNKEAWNICYTPQYTIATLICNFNHSALNSDVNGSTYPTLINREIIKELYKKKLKMF